MIPADEKASVYAAFNARWISEEDVARTFVPSPAFTKLRHPTNSLLMGPRGCGKTTVLKMLTRRAVQKWGEYPATRTLERPTFETVYVPLDIKFSTELQFAEDMAMSDRKVVRAMQRVFVNLTTLLSIVDTYELLVEDGSEEHHALAEKLIILFKLGPRPPRLVDVRDGLLAWSDRLQRLVNIGTSAQLEAFLAGLPDLLFAKVYEPVIRLGEIFNGVQGTADAKVRHWCLAFDELEIGPKWLQDELLDALRSTHQSLYLKLTWAPTLPEHVRAVAPPRPKADYEIVKMWYSHVEDSRAFSRELMKRMIASRLGEGTEPATVFGHSEFSAQDEEGDSYGIDGSFYRRLRDLSRHDLSLRAYLKEKGINPARPTTDDPSLRNEILRKIKPIVILRDERMKQGGLRSRKRLAIYSGEDIISSMSDGNPRWLSLIVSELLDNADEPRDGEATELISREKQSRILRSISKRMLSWMRASPRPVFADSREGAESLEDLIVEVGEYFRKEVVGQRFPSDPSGSFRVDDSVPIRVKTELHRGVVEGAFLFVGSELDVIEKLDGARLRLSFMFAPLYALPLRNYRSIDLSTILGRTGGLRDDDADRSQQKLFKGLS